MGKAVHFSHSFQTVTAAAAAEKYKSILPFEFELGVSVGDDLTEDRFFPSSSKYINYKHNSQLASQPASQPVSQSI